jgi:hypothetical protein
MVARGRAVEWVDRGPKKGLGRVTGNRIGSRAKVGACIGRLWCVQGLKTVMNDSSEEPRHIDPALDETVADEEFDPVEGELVDRERPRPLRQPAPPPPPIPKFPERRGEPARHAPGIPRPGRERDRRWRQDLSDTPGLQDSRAAGAMSASDLERVEVEEIFDRPDRQAVGSTAEYDPEAGRTNVAIKIQAVRRVVSTATATPFGKLVLTFPVVMTGIVLTILAIVHQQLWVCIAAAVVMPLGLWLLYMRYQAWLGHKRYMYRLLETLGEDVSDFDAGRKYRRVGKPLHRRRR